MSIAPATHAGEVFASFDDAACLFEFSILAHIQRSPLLPSPPPPLPPPSSELHMADIIRDDVHGLDEVILSTLPPTGLGRASASHADA